MKRVLILTVLVGGSLMPLCMPASAQASGTISATPNPCVIARKSTCTTYVSWSTTGVAHARVYAVAEGSRGREEKEFSASRSCEKCEAQWIEKTVTFTLYDYSSGNRGRALGTVTVTAIRGSEKQGELSGPDASGNISANPNPCVIVRQSTCTTYVSWSTKGVEHARVYAIAEGSRGREEKEFSASRSCEKCEAQWIEKTATFTLYDYSSGNRGRALGTVTVTAIRK